MYTPHDSVLRNYAKVLIDFALGSGEGIKKNEVIYLQFDILAMPLALHVYRRILERGAHPMVKINEDDFSRIYYEVAEGKQLDFFPKKYMKSMVDTIDHRIYLIADKDPFLLKNVDPAKIMRANKKTKLMRKWLFKKEDEGRFTWTLALYGTEGMAAEAGLSLKEFWEQIEEACFLKAKNPLKKWNSVFVQTEKIRAKLSDMPIDTLNVRSKETDLTVKLGEKRKWMGGSGRNIPSFELFTSPDWRGTEGHIFFDYPLYRYGNLIKDIRLEFKKGKVVEATASKNEKLLKELIKQKNADKIGEYSLTDIRFSHITKFMANTLYDENFGGTWGNTHLALGSSYHDAYKGDLNSMKAKDWKRLGFNESPEHTDIIATNDRTVEATMLDGSKKIIYSKGKFRV